MACKDVDKSELHYSVPRSFFIVRGFCSVLILVHLRVHDSVLSFLSWSSSGCNICTVLSVHICADWDSSLGVLLQAHVAKPGVQGVH